MPSSPLDAASFNLIGHLTDEHLDVLAQLLVDLDAETDHHAPALPKRNGDNPTGNGD